MAREHWRDDYDHEARRSADPRDREDFGQADYSEDYVYDPRTRTARRTDEVYRDRDDFGQGDYAADWAWDRDQGRAYRRYGAEDRTFDRSARLEEGRREIRRDATTERRGGRRGSSDRVLWAVIMERLEEERRLDLRDVDVSVHDGEVTLSGTARNREQKRRIEDICDIDGVRNVQNNLRPRDAGRRWSLF